MPDVAQIRAVVGLDDTPFGPAAKNVQKEFSNVERSAENAGKAIDRVSDRVEKNSNIFGKHKAALKGSAADLEANSKASKENADAAEKMTHSRSKASSEISKNASAIKAETDAIEANSKAKGENATKSAGGISQGDIAAGAFKGGLLAELAASIPKIAIDIAHHGGNFADRRRGLTDVSFEDTIQQLNPFNNNEQRIEEENRKATEEVMKRGGKGWKKDLQQQALEARRKQRGDTARLGELEFGATLKGAEASLAGMDREERAEAELQKIVPLLNARRKALQTLAAKTRAEIQKDPQAQLEYLKIQSEIADLEGESNQIRGTVIRNRRERQEKLAKDAEKLRKEQQKEAEKQAREAAAKAKQEYESQTRAQQLIFASQMEAAEIQASGAKKGEEAATELMVLYPVIEQRQKQIAEDAKKFTKGSEEYAKREREWWKLEGEQNKLRERMNKERDDNLKKAADEKKKAIEKANKNIQNQVDLVGARQGLAEAVLANNPYLSEQQKKQSMLPLLMQELKALGRAPEGETEVDKLRRQTEIQRTRGKIYDAHGLNQMHPSQINPRALRYLENEIDRSINSGAQETTYKNKLPFSDSYLRSQMLQSQYGNNPQTGWARNQSGGIVFNNNFMTVTRQQMEQAFLQMMNQSVRAVFSGTAPE